MPPPRAPYTSAHTQSEPTIRGRLEELNTVSSREAAALAAWGKKAGLWQVSLVPLFAFLRSYLWQGEWRRGIAGWVTALFAGYEAFVRYVKLWEMYHSNLTLPPHQEGSESSGSKIGKGGHE
jgi:hypothetical protein